MTLTSLLPIQPYVDGSRRNMHEYVLGEMHGSMHGGFRPYPKEAG